MMRLIPPGSLPGALLALFLNFAAGAAIAARAGKGVLDGGFFYPFDGFLGPITGGLVGSWLAARRLQQPPLKRICLVIAVVLLLANTPFFMKGLWEKVVMEFGGWDLISGLAYAIVYFPATLFFPSLLMWLVAMIGALLGRQAATSWNPPARPSKVRALLMCSVYTAISFGLMLFWVIVRRTSLGIIVFPIPFVAIYVILWYLGRRTPSHVDTRQSTP